MKAFFLTLACLSVVTLALPQDKSGSIDQTTASVIEMVDHTKIDSVFKSPQVPDSLLDLFEKANSIRASFNRDADSLKLSYQRAISRIDEYDSALRHRVDSLKKLKLPTVDYTATLDSLTIFRRKTEDIFQSKLDELKAKSSAKLLALDLPLEYKPALEEVTKSIEDLKIHSDGVKIPALDISSYSLKEVGNLSAVGLKGEVEQLGDFRNTPKLERQIGELDQVTQKLTGYQDDIKNVTEGNLKDVQQVPQTMEEQAAKVEGVKELQKQSTLLEAYKVKLPDLKNPNEVKEQAAQIVKNVGVDHFVGKEEQLKTAMEKMAKYKQKFSSVSSLKNLPKSARNSMRDKPFVDRWVPGVYFQYQQKDFYLVDINLYIGYKLTGRFTPGLGWNKRYAYDKSNLAFILRSSIYGPRAFLDFKLRRGFVAHLEGEAVNTFVPWTLGGNPDVGKREWVWSFMTGIKKEYRVHKNLKGTALIQYNWFNRYYKAPYVDRLNSRIGFEYTLKKKRRE